MGSVFLLVSVLFRSCFSSFPPVLPPSSPASPSFFSCLSPPRCFFPFCFLPSCSSCSSNLSFPSSSYLSFLVVSCSSAPFCLSFSVPRNSRKHCAQVTLPKASPTFPFTHVQTKCMGCHLVAKGRACDAPSLQQNCAFDCFLFVRFDLAVEAKAKTVTEYINSDSRAKSRNTS